MHKVDRFVSVGKLEAERIRGKMVNEQRPLDEMNTVVVKNDKKVLDKVRKMFRAKNKNG